LRAYICVDDVIIDFMNFSYDLNVKIIIKNFGQTPGRKIKNTFDVRPIFAGKRDDKNLSLASSIPGELADLAPTQPVASQTTYPLAVFNNIRPALLNKTMLLYVFGRIDYIDVFEDTQSTYYRYRLLVDKSGIPKGKTHLIMEGHAGNRTS
jgi:hypothetical protein